MLSFISLAACKKQHITYPRRMAIVQNAGLKFTNDSLLYRRYQNLWAQNIGTQVNLDNARTQFDISYNQKRSAREKYRSAVNDLQLAMKNAKSLAVGSKADLENYFIRAESNGTVYQLFKEQGEAVKMNEPVALLGRSGARLIRLSVDQEDIRQVRTGQTVLLKTDVSGDRIYQAKVNRDYPPMPLFVIPSDIIDTDGGSAGGSV